MLSSSTHHIHSTHAEHSIITVHSTHLVPVPMHSSIILPYKPPSPEMPPAKPNPGSSSHGRRTTRDVSGQRWPEVTAEA